MGDGVTFEWVKGPVREEQLDEIARLFVMVDAAFGDEAWWFDVRNGGVDGAITNLRQSWHGHVVVETDDGAIIGFGAMATPLKDSVEFSRIMVHPDWRHRGVGTTIIEELKGVAEDNQWMPWVDVLETSVEAIALYDRTGFETVGYQYGRDSGRLARQMRYKPSVI